MDEAVVTTAEWPLNVTAFALGVALKSFPANVTIVPAGPNAGEKPVTTGADPNAKFAALVAVSEPMVTVRGPDVLPAGSVAIN